MEKSKYYFMTRFSPQVLGEAHALFLSRLASKEEKSVPYSLRITTATETWELDTLEEFLTESPTATAFCLDHILPKARLRVVFDRSTSNILVNSSSRADIEAIFHIFQRNVDASRIIATPIPIRVFIGHGRDSQWRDLKDHLHEQHGLDVVAYEIGPRAGLSVKDVLGNMLAASSFALLALTGEDEQSDGQMHARQNVVHELGLFQGRLGFTRAIVLLEDGVQEFSNILGVNQIRFSKGNIRETFGDVVATIRREFGTT